MIGIHIKYDKFACDINKFGIYIMNSHKVRELMSDNKPALQHTVIWNGFDDNGNPVFSGVYLSCLRLRQHVAMGRMVLKK